MGCMVVEKEGSGAGWMLDCETSTPLILAMVLIDVFGLMSVVCQGIIIIFFKKLYCDFHYTVRLFFPNLPTICLDSTLEIFPDIPSRRAE